MIGRAWSEGEDRRLRDLARSGLTVPQIALEMNRSRSVIQRHAVKLRIKIATGIRVMNRVDRLVDLGLRVKSK
jgi:hypothetical protein